MTPPDLSGFHWQPALPLPLLYTLGGIAAVSALIFIPLARDQRWWSKAVALLLRLLAIAALVGIALNPVSEERQPMSQRSAALLLDNSTSMMLGQRSRDASAFSKEVATAFGASGLKSLTYDTEIHPWNGEALHPDGSGRNTRLGAAIRRALEADPAPASLMVVGDGGADDREALDSAMAMAKDRKVPIHFHPVGGEDPLANAWISGLRTPSFSRPNTSAKVDVWVASQQITGEMKVTVRDSHDKVLDTATTNAGPDPSQVSMKVPVGLRTETYRVVVEPDIREAVTQDNELTFSLIVADPKIKVLFMEGTHCAHEVAGPNYTKRWNAIQVASRAWESTGEIDADLYTVLSQWNTSSVLMRVNRFLGGGMELDTARGFPSKREDLFKYDVVICSDIARGNFTDEEMQAVQDLVIQRGGGFCMIGGSTSFDSGAYDKTLWDKIIPVDMAAYGYGTSEGVTQTLVPKEVRQHPIWRISPDPSRNDEILDSHPAFFGHHDIRRTKPGATVLATLGDGVSPLIAVQSYGRGRSMAFLSDLNGSWGREYLRWGEEISQSHITSDEEFRDVADSAKGMTDNDAVPPDMPHPSPYYAQFWINTVRWLAENSVRRLGEGISGRASNSVARPGKELGISAEITAGIPMEEMAGMNVTARLFLPGSQPQRLTWNRERREFTGNIAIPSSLDSKTVGIVFETPSNANLSTRLDLPVLFLNPEIENTTASTGLLRDLAAATGGKEITDPQAAAALLHSDIDASEKTEVLTIHPGWDKTWFWTGLVVVLGLEWLVRKVGRFAI